MTTARAATLQETLGLRQVPPNGTAWHGVICAGLPYRSLSSTARAIGLSDKSLGAVLLLAPRTLAARKKAKRLSSAESDVIYAIARAFVRLASFKSVEATRKWLLSPADVLKGAQPLEMLRTRLGTEYVMSVIERERAAVLPKLDVRAPNESDNSDEEED